MDNEKILRALDLEFVICESGEVNDPEDGKRRFVNVGLRYASGGDLLTTSGFVEDEDGHWDEQWDDPGDGDFRDLCSVGGAANNCSPVWDILLRRAWREGRGMGIAGSIDPLVYIVGSKISGRTGDITREMAELFGVKPKTVFAWLNGYASPAKSTRKLMICWLVADEAVRKKVFP